MVGEVNATSSFQVPQAAIYTDGNVNFQGGGGNVFAVTASGAPDTSKSAAVEAGGNFVGNWSTSLSPTGGAQTVDIDTNGTVTNPKNGIWNFLLEAVDKVTVTGKRLYEVFCAVSAGQSQALLARGTAEEFALGPAAKAPFIQDIRIKLVDAAAP